MVIEDPKADALRRLDEVIAQTQAGAAKEALALALSERWASLSDVVTGKEEDEDAGATRGKKYTGYGAIRVSEWPLPHPERVTTENFAAALLLLRFSGLVPENTRIVTKFVSNFLIHGERTFFGDYTFYV